MDTIIIDDIVSTIGLLSRSFLRRCTRTKYYWKQVVHLLGYTKLYLSSLSPSCIFIILVFHSGKRFSPVGRAKLRFASWKSIQDNLFRAWLPLQRELSGWLSSL